MTEVGKVTVRAEIDSSKVAGQLGSLKGQVNSAAGEMESSFSKLGGVLKTGLLAAGVAAAGLATVGLSEFKNLEAAASSAASKSVDVNGKSVEQIKAQYDSLQKHVMAVSEELGASTVFDATDVAASMDALAGAGQNVANVGKQELLPFLNLAAQDMEFGLGNTTSLMMSVMNGFGMSMKDTTKIGDMLTKAVNGTGAGLQDFKDAMVQGGAAAAGTGMPLEEYLAIVGKIKDHSISGSMAGDAFKAAISALGSPTKVQTEALAKLGLTFEDINPRTHKFVDTLKLLKSRNADIIDFGNIFTDSSGQVMYWAAQETDAVKALSGSIKDSDGLSQTMADLTMGTDKLVGAWENAKGATSSLYTAIGAALEPAAVKLLNTWSALVPKIKEFATALIGGDWGKVGDMMSKGIKAGWDKLKDLGKDLYNKIKSVNWGGLGSYVTKGIKSAWGELKSLGSQLLGYLKGVDYSSIGSSVAVGLVGIGQWLYDAIAGIDWGGLVSLVVGYLGALKDYYLGIGKGLYDALVSVDWGSIGTKVLDSLKNIGSEIAKIFSGINFGDIGKGILDSLSGIGDKVLGFFENVPWASVGKWLADGIKNGIQSLTGIANTVADLFKKHSWDGVGSDIGNKIKSAIGQVSGWLDKAIDGAKSSVAGWGDIGTKAGEAIKNALGAIKDYASGIYTNIKDGLKTWIMGQDLKDLGALVMDGLAGGLAAAVSVLHTAWKTIFSWETLKEVADWTAMGLLAIGNFVTGFLAEGVNLGGELAARVLEGFGAALNTSSLFSGLGLGDTLTSAAASIRAGSTTQSNYMKYGPDALKAGFVAPTTIGDRVLGTTNAKNAPEPARSVDAEGNVYEYGKLTGNIFQAEEEAGKKIAEDERKIRLETAQKEAEIISNTVAKATLTRADIEALWTQKAGGPIKYTWEQPTAPTKKSATISTTSGTPEPISRIEGYGSVSGAMAVAKQLASAGYTLEEVNAKLYKWAQDSKGLLPSGADIKKGYDEGAAIWRKESGNALLAEKKLFDMTMYSADYVQNAFEKNLIGFDESTKQWYWKSTTAAKEAASATTTAAKDAASTTTTAASSAAATTTAAAVPVQEAALSFKEQIWKTVSDTDQMWRATNEVIKFGVDEQGKRTAVIGQVAQQNWAAGGKAFVDGTTVAGTTLGAKISTAGTGLQNSLQVGANSVGSALQNGASALNGAASSIGSMVGAVTGRAFSSIFGGSASPASPAQPTGSGLWSWGGKPKGMARGGETSGPQMALIGEAGKEFVIPTKNKRWDLLLAAMRSYGIKTFAEGGEAGSGGGAEAIDADKMTAYFGITGLASMSKQVQKIINNLKDFFRISWGIIKSEGSVYWRQINQIITAEATMTRDAAWQAAIDIRNTWLSSNAQILEDTTNSYKAIYPAIIPSLAEIHDGSLATFADMGNQIKGMLEQVGSDTTTFFGTFRNNWDMVWSQMLSDLQATSSQISSLLQGIAAEVNNIAINVSVNGGGAGGGGGMSYSSGGGGGSGSIADAATTFTDCLFEGFTDTCTGIIVNALKYTSPSGQTSYINPLTYLDNGGISNYQGSGGGGGGYSLPAVFRARGGLVEKPELDVIADQGPEIILPNKLTRMFVALADAGMGQVSGGAGSAKIVIEDRTEHHWYMDGKEVTNQIMSRVQKQLQLKGAISTR